MTVYGVDIHPTFQSGLDVGVLRRNGIDFLLCKVTEGDTWYRSGYHDIAAAARSRGLLLAAYHFLRSESSGQAQAAHCARSMGADWGVVPVMVDWETSVDNTWAEAPTANAFAAEVRRLGGKVTLNYLPHWYWTRIGSPSLAAGPVSTLALIQSAYGTNPVGSPAALYPGDTSSRWAGFGGKTVSILQFGSRCRIDGYSGQLDVNAYRGTRADLARTGWFHDPAPEEDDMFEEADRSMLKNIQGRAGEVYPIKSAVLSILQAVSRIDGLDDQIKAELDATHTELIAAHGEVLHVAELVSAIQAGDPDAIAAKLDERLSPALQAKVVDALNRLRISVADPAPES